MRLGIKLDKTGIISAAESLLPPEWGGGVRLHVDETYENANTVVMRSSLANHTESAPSRVAIKHVRAYDGFYTSLGRSAREMSSRLRAIWRAEETSLPYYPAFCLLT